MITSAKSQIKCHFVLTEGIYRMVRLGDSYSHYTRNYI